MADLSSVFPSDMNQQQLEELTRVAWVVAKRLSPRNPEDAVAEALWHFLKKVREGQYRPEAATGGPSGYLVTIVRRVAQKQNARAKKAFEKAREKFASEHAEIASEPAEGDEERAKQRRSLRKVLRELNPDDRELLLADGETFRQRFAEVPRRKRAYVRKCRLMKRVQAKTVKEYGRLRQS